MSIVNVELSTAKPLMRVSAEGRYDVGGIVLR